MYVCVSIEDYSCLYTMKVEVPFLDIVYKYNNVDIHIHVQKI